MAGKGLCDGMKRRFLHFIIIFFTMITLCYGASLTVHAYTEEEKQQAKAWLSAHGYSPDMNGANQAYQDYLNGKFDDELGITTTEQASTQSTEITTEAQSTIDDKTEQDAKSTKEKAEKAAKVSDNEQDAGQNGGLPTKGKASADGDVEDAGMMSEDSDQETAGTGQTIAAGLDAVDDVESQEVTLYRTEKLDTYKEAATVIVLSVMLVAVFLGFRQLLKHSDKE